MLIEENQAYFYSSTDPPLPVHTSVTLRQTPLPPVILERSLIRLGYVMVGKVILGKFMLGYVSLGKVKLGKVRLSTIGKG